MGCFRRHAPRGLDRTRLVHDSAQGTKGLPPTWSHHPVGFCFPSLACADRKSTTASIAYFCMASALGRVPIPTEFAGANGYPAGTTRSIWVSQKILHTKVANTDLRSTFDTSTGQSRPQLYYSRSCLLPDFLYQTSLRMWWQLWNILSDFIVSYSSILS